MKTIYYSLLMAILLLGACTTNEPDPGKTADPIQLTSVMQQRVGQDNDFSFDLLKKTIANTGEANVFISPLSVSMALGMVRNGAEGTTKTEMNTALKLSGLTDAEINEYYRLMQTTLPGLDPKTKLSIANSIWIRQSNDFTVKPAFLKTNTDYFNSYVKMMDFNQQWAVDTINGWAKRNTNGLIPEVIKSIDPYTMMLLMNAIYFKGTWVTQFDKKATMESDFTNEAGHAVKVNMMHVTDTFAYADDDQAQYLEMPYGNKAFSMTVVLPDQGKTITDILGKLTAASFADITGKMENQKVHVVFPRFKVKQTFQLNKMLQDMGMKKAFQENAELDGIAALKPLFVSFVKHDTYVEVTEEGTEAAAVTTIGVGTTSVDPLERYFIADRPFLFVIREKSTGIIIFIGKMGSVEKF